MSIVLSKKIQKTNPCPSNSFIYMQLEFANWLRSIRAIDNEIKKADALCPPLRIELPAIYRDFLHSGRVPE